MIKIAIVDDEEQTREQILRTLKENIQEQHEVEIKLYVSGESFFEEIQKGHAADILFTDIQMQQLDGVVSIPIEISILFGNSEHPFPERKNMPFRSRVQPFI